MQRLMSIRGLKLGNEKKDECIMRRFEMEDYQHQIFTVLSLQK